MSDNVQKKECFHCDQPVLWKRIDNGFTNITWDQHVECRKKNAAMIKRMEKEL